MSFTFFPHSAGTHATGSAQQRYSQTSEKRSLRQIIMPSRHVAGGVLQQDGIDDHNRGLTQRSTAPRQRSGLNLRERFQSLRQKVSRSSDPLIATHEPQSSSAATHYAEDNHIDPVNALPQLSPRKKLQKRLQDIIHPSNKNKTDDTTFSHPKAALPVRQGPEPDFSRLTRNSSYTKTPGLRGRIAPATTDVSDTGSSTGSTHSYQRSALFQVPDSQQPGASNHTMETIPETPDESISDSFGELRTEKAESGSKLNFMQQQALLAAEQDNPEREETLLTQQASLRLSGEGKLIIAGASSENLSNVLRETVARPEQVYQTYASNAENTQHLLLDKQGYMFSLHGSQMMFVGLAKSTRVTEGQKTPLLALPPTLAKKSDQATIRYISDSHAIVDLPATKGTSSIQHTITLPGSAIYAKLTGIYSYKRKVKAGNEIKLVDACIREFDERLYRLDTEEMLWYRADKNDDKKIGKVTKQPNGMVYMVRNKGELHNLSNNSKILTIDDHKISHYCVIDHNEMLALLTNKKTAKQSAIFLDKTRNKWAIHKTALKTISGDTSVDFHATAITHYKDRIFAISSEGKLFSAPRPEISTKEIILAEDEERTRPLLLDLKGQFALDGFLNHGDGHFIITVKDRNNQRHACTMRENGHFRADWNMADSLVMDHHRGLLQPHPLPQEMVDLGRLGQLVVHNEKINIFNKSTQRWEATWEWADSLKRGQDGQAYMIKDGIASRVKVTLKTENYGGTNNKLIMRQMKSNLSIEPPLPGLHSKNKATAIAPLDAERYVALNTNNELQFHRNRPDSRDPDKLVKRLTKRGIDNHVSEPGVEDSEIQAHTGENNTLVDIAIDKKQNLYVLDKQGKLYSMPGTSWQEENRDASLVTWKAVPLPAELKKIEKLHNASDGSLMVADSDGRSAIFKLAGQRLEAEVKQEESPFLSASIAINQIRQGINRNRNKQDSEQREKSDPRVTVELRSVSADNSITHPVEKPLGISQNLDTEHARQISVDNHWLVQAESSLNETLARSSHRRKVEKAWERLDHATKSKRLLGMTVKQETSLFGVTGRDGTHINSRVRDRIRAHVFNPTIAVPRPMKNAAYKARHKWQGRDGLRSLYQHQATLHQQLKTLLEQTSHKQNRQDIRTRLEKLSHTPFDQEWMTMIRKFAGKLNHSTAQHTAYIGREIRAIKINRTENDQFSAPWKKPWTELNNALYRSDENLLDALCSLYQQYPADSNNAEESEHGVPSLLNILRKQQVSIRYQKAKPAMNRQRDPYDNLNLSKSQLILNGLTLQKLHLLVDKMEKAETSAQKEALQEEFRLLHDVTYGDDPVNLATSFGFVNTRQLEASYDAIKSMTKAFSKPHHGVNMTSRTVLKKDGRLVDQAKLAKRLYWTIKSLESDEKMGFNRNYGGFATISVIPVIDQIMAIPALRLNFDRAYSVSFSRKDTGINVNFSRNGGTTGTPFSMLGWTPFSSYDESGESNHSLDIGSGRTLSPSFRIGALIALAMQKQQQNSISFLVSEAELGNFIEQLTHGTIDPMDIMKRSVGHKMKSSTTLTFNVDVSAVAAAGGGLRLPLGSGGDDSDSDSVSESDSASETSSISDSEFDSDSDDEASQSTEGPKAKMQMRANGLLRVGTNLLSAQRERTVAHTAYGENRTRSDNRLRMFNNVKAEAGFIGGAGLSLKAADNVRIPALGVNSTNIQVSIDNQTKQEINIEFGPVDAPEKIHLDRLVLDTGLNFDDAGLSMLTQAIKDSVAEASAITDKQKAAFNKKAPQNTADISADIMNEVIYKAGMNEKQVIRYKLNTLIEKLKTKRAAHGSQYAVLDKARQFEMQQLAADYNSQGLVTAEFQTTYNNLNKIKSNNIMHTLHKIISSELPPSNAEQINRFMGEKPMLKAVINTILENIDTQAVVTLELKDSKKYEAQQLWLNKDAMPEDIRNLLKDRRNMRIKSISFTETNSKAEGINLPLIVAGYNSSASVQMSRNLGKINFKYGQDQNMPHSFNLEGEIAYASEETVNALKGSEKLDKRGLVAR